MSGLILKDILVMRKAIRTYAIFLAVYLVLSIMGVFDVSVLTTMIVVLLMMLPITAFSYDEYTKWDHYAIALPLKRSALVGSRYLFTLFMALAALAVGLLAGLFMWFLHHDEILVSFCTVLLSLAIGILMADIMLPLCYKLGPERARPYMYIILIIPILAIIVFSRFDWFDHLTIPAFVDTPAFVCLISVLAVTVALTGTVISYLLSCRIMRQKEF